MNRRDNENDRPEGDFDPGATQVFRAGAPGPQPDSDATQVLPAGAEYSPYARGADDYQQETIDATQRIDVSDMSGGLGEPVGYASSGHVPGGAGYPAVDEYGRPVDEHGAAFTPEDAQEGKPRKKGLIIAVVVLAVAVVVLLAVLVFGGGDEEEPAPEQDPAQTTEPQQVPSEPAPAPTEGDGGDGSLTDKLPEGIKEKLPEGVPTEIPSELPPEVTENLPDIPTAEDAAQEAEGIGEQISAQLDEIIASIKSLFGGDGAVG